VETVVPRGLLTPGDRAPLVQQSQRGWLLHRSRTLSVRPTSPGFAASRLGSRRRRAASVNGRVAAPGRRPSLPGP